MPTLTPCVTREEILQVQQLVWAAPVSDHVIEFEVDLVGATRPGRNGSPSSARDFIEWGCRTTRLAVSHPRREGAGVAPRPHLR